MPSFCRRFQEALEFYSLCMVHMGENSPSIHSSLGITYHAAGLLDAAIQCYHKALGLRPGDTLTASLLTRALREVFEKPLTALPAGA